jgi:hypothetical protein
MCVGTQHRTNIVNNFKQQETYTVPSTRLVNTRTPKPQLHVLGYYAQMCFSSMVLMHLLVISALVAVNTRPVVRV